MLVYITHVFGFVGKEFKEKTLNEKKSFFKKKKKKKNFFPKCSKTYTFYIVVVNFMQKQTD